MDHDTVTLFVQDAITELEQRNARDVVEYLRMMLECDGPDVDGAVSSLVAYGAVTIAWIDRLAANTKNLRGSSTKNWRSCARGSRAPRLASRQRDP